MTRSQAGLSGNHDALGNSSQQKQGSIDSGTEDNSNDEPALARGFAKTSTSNKVREANKQ